MLDVPILAQIVIAFDKFSSFHLRNIKVIIKISINLHLRLSFHSNKIMLFEDLDDSVEGKINHGKVVLNKNECEKYEKINEVKSLQGHQKDKISRERLDLVNKKVN